MARFLTVFGFVWLLAGNIIGLVLSRRRDFQLADIEDLSSVEDLLEFYRRDWGYRWNKTCHAHSSLFSVVCVMVGVSLHVFNVPSSPLTMTLGGALISSVILWTVFSFRHVKPMMAGADVLFVGSILAMVYVLFNTGSEWFL